MFCEENNIRLDTSVAKEEHISNGNKLGIIDRFVRTLRQTTHRNNFNITGHRTDNIKDIINHYYTHIRIVYQDIPK